jgi:hypothetical protein
MLAEPKAATQAAEPSAVAIASTVGRNWAEKGVAAKDLRRAGAENAHRFHLPDEIARDMGEAVDLVAPLGDLFHQGGERVGWRDCGLQAGHHASFVRNADDYPRGILIRPTHNNKICYE